MSDTEAVIAALDRGEVRVAEPDGDDWRVNSDVQAAILDYFRLRQMEPREVGPFEYRDKIPLKSGYEELGVRVVPPATARYGAYLSPGVVLMPSYVNIGAWVGPNTMVDTWATVGSGAQIGANVHLAGGVGIGGVLEPPGARPVIVEDGAFLGSRCIVVEGVRIGREAVIAPNVTLTASVPIIDVTGPEPVEHRGYVPPRSVVVPGHAAEGVPGRHVPPLVRADHRAAVRVDRPADVAERRAARLRHRRLAHDQGQPVRPLAGRALQRHAHDVPARGDESAPAFRLQRHRRTVRDLEGRRGTGVDGNRRAPATDRMPFVGGASWKPVPGIRICTQEVPPKLTVDGTRRARKPVPGGARWPHGTPISLGCGGRTNGLVGRVRDLGGERRGTARVVRPSRDDERAAIRRSGDDPGRPAAAGQAPGVVACPAAST